MCGIAGIFDKIGHRQIDSGKLAVLSTHIHHRGRDDVGYFTDKGCGFVHRRLSILDATGGKQPMQSDDGHITLIFNGMIYNYIELRQKLQFAGHTFKTNSDTEVLLRAYMAYGTECVKYFDGFFAFAIYDKNQNSLFCARDTLGKKPFYYYVDDNYFFHFSSDLSGILDIMSKKPAVSASALQDYLTFGFIAEPKTLFEGIYKLESGQSLLIKRGGQEHIQFSDFSNNYLHTDFNTLTHYSEAKNHTAILLNNAIDKRLIADVPIGTLLSGGLDSGLITAMIAKKTDSITAFTASFNDKNLDEADSAAKLAKDLNIKHSVLKIDNVSESIIDDIALIAGEPFADATIIPLYLMCKAAKSQVTVLLSGDGGDELFAGYGRYPSFIKQETLKRILSLSTRQFLFGKLAEKYPQNLKVPSFLRAGATFEALSSTSAGGYLRNIAIARPQIIQSLLSDKIKTALNNYSSVKLLNPFFADAYDNALKAFDDARYCDIKLWLPSRMLVKSDRASMAAGIELRSPLLDLDLTHYALKMPYDFLKSSKGNKRILRDIAQDYLPSTHLNRPKQGFVMNIKHLLKNEWTPRLEAVVNDTALAEANLLDMKHLRKLATEHIRGHNDHSRILWAIIQLEAFLRIHNFL